MNLWIISFKRQREKNNENKYIFSYCIFFVYFFFVCLLLVPTHFDSNFSLAGILLKQKQKPKWKCKCAIRWNRESINRYEHTSKWNCSWASHFFSRFFSFCVRRIFSFFYLFAFILPHSVSVCLIPRCLFYALADLLPLVLSQIRFWPLFFGLRLTILPFISDAIL